MSNSKMIAVEGAIQSGSELADSNDPEYLAWKKAKISATLKHANEYPDDFLAHEQVFDKIRKKFRP